MFRRTFWFGTGVAAGVWATTRINQKLKQLSPDSLAASAANKALDAGARLRERAVGFALDVRDHMAQREAELDDALGLAAPVDRELTAPRRHTAIENRTNPQSVVDVRTTYSYNRNEDH